MTWHPGGVAEQNRVAQGLALLDVLILGGRPMREPVTARRPFEAGTLGTVPADHIGNA